MTSGRDTPAETINRILRMWAQRDRRPITLKEISKQTGVGATTVQRIVSRQHVSFRQGTPAAAKQVASTGGHVDPIEYAKAYMRTRINSVVRMAQ